MSKLPSLSKLSKINTIGVAIILIGGGLKSQITCNDVIKNFRKGILLWNRRYRRMEDQKPGLNWHVTRILLGGLEPKVKKFSKNVLIWRRYK